MTHTPAQLLEMLNIYRAADGKAPLADWRATRHQPMLDAYRAAQDARIDAATDFEASAEELAAQTIRPVADEPVDDVSTTESAVQEKAVELAKSKSYKEIANYDKSAIGKPVAFVHQFLDANPGMSRKEAVIALTEGYGVNYSTARTQYQRWFTAQKKGA